MKWMKSKVLTSSVVFFFFFFVFGGRKFISTTVIIIFWRRMKRWSGDLRRTLGLFIFVAVLAIGLYGVDACRSDNECRPSSCCHSVGCVDTTRANPPDCSDVLCTTHCEHGTLDCGGECRCDEERRVCMPHYRAGMPPDSAHTWKTNKAL
jgi:hypothetical protein